jgi:hypothetical protein
MIKINSLDELADLVARHRSIKTGHFRRMPAAFIMSMQATIVHREIKSGMYAYVPGCSCQTADDNCDKCKEFTND